MLSTALLFCALVLGATSQFVTAESHVSQDAPRLIFPSHLTTIDGNHLDLGALTRNATVVVVTLKAHWCPVCHNQLRRIKKNQDALSQCGVTFVVLAPGPREELAKLRDASGFDFPFVEDVGLSIASSLGLRLSADEIAPAILMLNRDLSVGWVQQGRNASYYGDRELMKEIACWNKIPI
jgi:peroxiredoxin